MVSAEDAEGGDEEVQRVFYEQVKASQEKAKRAMLEEID